jgi:hypothetical protein
MTVTEPTVAHSPRPLSRGWIAFILAVVFGSLALWSLCAGIAYVSLHGAPGTLPVPPGLGQVAARRSGLDWWTARVLSEVYTAALDHVVTDSDVIDLLGEPIEVDYDAEELFSRRGTGELNSQSETITFEIKGSKASATVTVVAATPQQPVLGQQLKINEISVTTTDGQQIFVDPPAPEQMTIR